MAAPRSKGFTLIELMVAIALMALMTLLGWKGLDGMNRALAQTRERSNDLLTIQAGLTQWRADLDAMTPVPPLAGLDWDGRVLRLTRRPAGDASEGMAVVAWTRRVVSGQGEWLRWQSPPLRSRGELQEAWLKAAIWAQNPGDEEKRREVAITRLDDWQVFYFRGDTWSNPLSSEGASQTTPAAPTGLAVQAVPVSALPDGVRVVLTLPPGQALPGKLTLDWVRPVVGGGKS